MTVPAPPTDPQTKGLWFSKTFWGTIIAFLTAVLPQLGEYLGVNITPAMVQTIGDNLWGIIQAIGGVFGTALAVYGRINATQKIAGLFGKDD